MKSIIYAFVLCPIFAVGQTQKNSSLSAKIGYGATDMKVKEAVLANTNILGVSFKQGKTFSGQGVQFGLDFGINPDLFVEVSTAIFSGEDFITKSTTSQGYLERSYTLKGFRLPISINYLIRNESKRLRIAIGAGFQYLGYTFQQFETTQSNGQTTEKVIADVKGDDVQLLLNPGLQYRIIPSLYVTYNINVGISVSGKSSSGGNIAIKYTFKNKPIAD